MVKEETNCRLCGGELKVELDLGKIYPSAFLSKGEEVTEDQKQPLVLAKCLQCDLVQLKHTIDLDLMYRQYWYSSSLNKSMVSSLADIVHDVESKISLSNYDVVLDIGCNDGTMLQIYPDSTIKIGFDPALNLKKPACTFINDYFSAKKYFEVETKPAKVVTAIAMFYDLPDPNEFVEDVNKVLANDGVFVIQLTDLTSMFRVSAFDNLCHEHLEYYSLEIINNLLEAHGLEIIDVSYNDVNGGSIRITSAHRGIYTVNKTVVEALVDERNYLLTHTFADFKAKIDETIYKVQDFLRWAKSHNHVIYLLGASTKGNTLLQICGITDQQISYAADVNKEKLGLRTVGSNIEIISEEDALIKHPAYFLVPIWHFKNSIVHNPKILDYLRANGRLVFPLPHFMVVSMNFDGTTKETLL